MSIVFVWYIVKYGCISFTKAQKQMCSHFRPQQAIVLELWNRVPQRLRQSITMITTRGHFIEIYQYFRLSTHTFGRSVGRSGSVQHFRQSRLSHVSSTNHVEILTGNGQRYDGLFVTRQCVDYVHPDIVPLHISIFLIYSFNHLRNTKER